MTPTALYKCDYTGRNMPKPIHPTKQNSAPPARANVILHTWGTDVGAGNGLGQFLYSELYGGNVGHASLEISFPADEQGKALLQKYCIQKGIKKIPFEKITKTVIRPDGTVDNEDWYTVYFSWWPSKDEDKAYTLHKNLNVDNTAERPGRNQPKVDPRFDLEQETRLYHGMLGSRQVILSTNVIQHNRDLGQDELHLLDLERQIASLNNDLEAIDLLTNKLSKIEHTTKAKGSLLQLLNRYFNNWQSFLGSNKQLDKNNAEELVSFLSTKKAALKEQLSTFTTERNKQISTLQQIHNQQIAEQTQWIKEQLANNPKPTPDKIAEIQNQSSYYAWLIVESEKNALKANNFAQYFLPFLSNADLKQIKACFIDDNYPENVPEFKRLILKQWRDYCPQDFSLAQPITDESIQKLKAAMTDYGAYLVNHNEKLMNERLLYAKANPLMVGDYEAYLTKGLNPDNTITLPVGSLCKDRKGPGLNVEKMLAKMSDIVDAGEDFDLFHNSCSSTTGAILYAGAESESQAYFNEKAWGTFGNPQTVLNGAMKYQHAQYKRDGKLSLGEKIARFNPLNLITKSAGKLLSVYVDPKTGPLASILLVLPVVAMGFLAGGATAIKAAANPKKSYKNCRKFISYANKQPSAFLKVCAIPVAGLAAALAVPAAIQTGITSLFRLPKTIKNRTKPYQAAPLPIADDNIVEIKDKDPEQALYHLHEVIESPDEKVPVFSEKTQKRVVAYVHGLKRSAPDTESDRVAQYEKDIHVAFDRVKRRKASPQETESKATGIKPPTRTQ